MTEFERELSSFPDKTITRHNFENIADETALLINEINSLRAQGDYDAAADKLRDNAEALSRCIVDAVTFRTWEEEIYNTQLYAKQVQQSIYFDETEDDFNCIAGDVWLGGD